MVVPNTSPAHSVKEFIAYAKTNKLSYASSGNGTSLHLAGELFKRQAGIEMTHVPYRGAGPAFNDLIPGRVDAMINFTSSSLPLVRQGQLRALSVTTAKRLSVAPDVPTMAEAGVPGVEVSSWSAFFVPARTPQDIVRKIHSDTVAALAEPAVREKLEQGGIVVIGSTPDELASFLNSEMDRWGRIIKAANIRAQYRCSRAPNDLDRLPASAELHEPREFLAPSTVTNRLLVAGLLPAHRKGARAWEVRSRLF
jgi:tripartite-type tricarboxylate transporter receptor subunit TctC